MSHRTVYSNQDQSHNINQSNMRNHLPSDLDNKSSISNCIENRSCLGKVAIIALLMLAIGHYMSSANSKTKSKTASIVIADGIKEGVTKKSIKLPLITEEHDGLNQHLHNSYVFTYPTVGCPNPGTPFNSKIVSWFQRKDFEREFMSMLKPYNDTSCQYQRFGNNHDGGYVICKNFLGEAEAMLNFGIEERDELGCDITSQFKMINYQYDCTSSVKPRCHTNNRSNVYEEICAGERTQTVDDLRFMSLEDIIKERKLDGKKIILKVDMEQAEFPALKYFPTEMLDNIVMIIGQIHLIDDTRWGYLDVIRSITEKFVNVNLHMTNWYCYGGLFDNHLLTNPASEVALVNKKFIKINKPTRSFKLHSKNRISFADRPDCQLHD